MKSKFIRGIVGPALLAATLAAAREPAIIPQPQELTRVAGDFCLTPDTGIFTDKASTGTGKFLAGRLRPSTGWHFRVHDRTAPFQGVSDGIVLTTNGADASLGPEGYQLVVATNGVVIRAPAQAGLFYGVQTLLQLLPPEIFSPKPVRELDWTVPCVQISDSPRFAWRGFMLDVSRHFFTKTEVEQALDLMAIYKLNTFHWHLVDDQGWRIQIRHYPQLTSVGAWRAGIGFGLDPKSSTAYDKYGRYGGFYTQRDIREVVAYASARHITIVPEIEMPGHSTAALVSYPVLACPGIKLTIPLKSGVHSGVYCAGNDDTFVFLQNVLGEVAGLFPGKYIHIGGDEVQKSNWMACAKCQLRIEKEGLKDEKELQAYFIRRIQTIAAGQGKNIIGWSEIREGGLAPGAALMDWTGGGTESAQSGHMVVMSPSKYCYLDHYQSTNHLQEPRAQGGFLPLAQIYAFEPVSTNLASADAAHVLGGQANLWTEYIPDFRHAEYMMFPRLAALAETVWSPRTARDWDDFKARAAQNERRLEVLGVNFRPLSKPD